MDTKLFPYGKTYGQPPVLLSEHLDLKLSEVMHYLYLPIVMGGDYDDVRLPYNVTNLHTMVDFASKTLGWGYKYCYLSAVRGIATPGNALNRPGWHCDGFGTDDINVIWWKGPGTRFAIQSFEGISEDDKVSLAQFDAMVDESKVTTFAEGFAYGINPYVVHATPVIDKPTERQFVKLSFSNEKYNLEGNSHNYLFGYKWDMVRRDIARNMTNKDFVKA